MTTIFDTSVMNPLGLAPPRVVKFRAINRTARTSALGEVAKLDIVASDGDVTANTTGFGGSGDPFSNLVPVAAGDSDAGANRVILAVSLESIADNATGWWALKGFIKIMGGGTAAVGIGLSPIDSAHVYEFDTAAVNDTVFAYPAVATADGVLNWAFFDGTGGLGSVAK